MAHFDWVTASVMFFAGLVILHHVKFTMGYNKYILWLYAFFGIAAMTGFLCS